MPTTNSLDRAIKLGRLGKHREAVRLLLPLSKSHPRSTAVFGCLGSAYLELNNAPLAARAFRRAVELNPKSELASLGLFHSLWDQGLATEAFAEMRRFLSFVDSTEYKTLLRDLAVEGHLAPHLQPAGAA